MSTIKTRPFDMANHLGSEEEITEYQHQHQHQRLLHQQLKPQCSHLKKLVQVHHLQKIIQLLQRKHHPVLLVLHKDNLLFGKVLTTIFLLLLEIVSKVKMGRCMLM